MKDITAILVRRFPGKEWSLIGEDYADLEWLDDSPKPTEEELNSLWDSVKLEIEEEAKNRVSQRDTVLFKLEALGLTIDDLKALGL